MNMVLQVNDKVALHDAPFGQEGRVLRIGHYSPDAGIAGVLVLWSTGVAWTHYPTELVTVNRGCGLTMRDLTFPE